MFDFLRKKISSWVGKEDKKEKKKSKNKGKTEKRSLQKSKKKSEKTTKKEEIRNEKPEVIANNIPEPIENKQEETKKEKEEQPKKDNFFTRLVKRISTSKLTQEQFEEIFQELEIILLENNVALEAVDKIKENLAKDLVGKESKGQKAKEEVLRSLKESILSLLIEPPNLIEKIKDKKEVYTILFFGINGTGKTTTIAKIARLLQKENISCVLAAADTFRAASIEQLQTHGKRLNVPVIAHDYNTDPAAVAFDAIAYAKKEKIKVVLIDTAGRMYTKDNLLKEMEKIVRVSKPDLKIFVGESITGNDAIDQAKTFNESIGIDGIVLSKADIDEKAGTILSVSHVTNKPIYFLGIGQDYDDLEKFTKKTVLKNIGLE